MSQELPRSRLATTDETGRRVYLYPASVKGKYSLRKGWAHAGMLLFFLLLPWVQVDGHQLLLLDVARREFFFFGLHFRAHDTPLILLLFLSFTFTIGFITAAWGRVWCGWACPQTVFTEGVFRRIERWVEGTHLERRALDEAPLSPKKLLRKSAKWGLFLAVSLVITHSFLAYFVGSHELIGMVSGSPRENWPSFLVILFTTGVILFDFGWFREQFCVIMCPYGRFQSVLLDSHSTVVGYDAKRGEPRRGAVSAGGTQGDCVDCYRCVTVCPTGIDIRRGLQMECIACTACIDACDQVMEKTRKPLGLIRYTSLSELSGRTRRRFTLRAGIYLLLVTGIVLTLVISLGRKDFLEALVLRAPGNPYDVVTQGEAKIVLNHFRLELSNQTGKDEKVELRLADSESKAGIQIVMPQNPLPLPNNASQRADFFLRFPNSALSHGNGTVHIELKTSDSIRELEVAIVGPDA